MLDFGSFQAITFDCYGTLIDWETGLLGVLRPLVAQHRQGVTDDEILQAYAEIEPALQSGPFMNYRLLLEDAARAMGKHFGFPVSDPEARKLPDSMVSWMPFPDTVAALRELKGKYRLGIISNTDDDLFAQTARHLQVSFDWVTTAQQARAYKPARAIFDLALQKLGLPADKILHAGQSIYHDVIPAKNQGMSTVLVKRRGYGAVKRTSAQPDVEVPDLRTLADMARERVPSAKRS